MFLRVQSFYGRGSCSRFGVQGFGFRVRVSGFGLRVEGVGGDLASGVVSMVPGGTLSMFRFSQSGCWVSDVE